MYVEFAFTSPNWKAFYLLVSLPCFTLLCFTLPSFCYSFFNLHTLSFASLYALWRKVCLSLSLNQLDAKPLLRQIMLSLFLGCLCVSTFLLEIVTFLLIGYCSYPIFPFTTVYLKAFLPLQHTFSVTSSWGLYQSELVHKKALFIYHRCLLHLSCCKGITSNMCLLLPFHRNNWSNVS